MTVLSSFKSLVQFGVIAVTVAFASCANATESFRVRNVTRELQAQECVVGSFFLAPITEATFGKTTLDQSLILCASLDATLPFIIDNSTFEASAATARVNGVAQDYWVGIRSPPNAKNDGQDVTRFFFFDTNATRLEGLTDADRNFFFLPNVFPWRNGEPSDNDVSDQDCVRSDVPKESGVATFEWLATKCTNRALPVCQRLCTPGFVAADDGKTPLFAPAKIVVLGMAVGFFVFAAVIGFYLVRATRQASNIEDTIYKIAREIPQAIKDEYKMRQLEKGKDLSL